MTEVLSHPEQWECMTCGHEWPREIAADPGRIVKDAHGNVLADGDCVILIQAHPPRGRGSRNFLQSGWNGRGFESLLR